MTIGGGACSEHRVPRLCASNWVDSLATQGDIAGRLSAVPDGDSRRDTASLELSLDGGSLWLLRIARAHVLVYLMQSGEPACTPLARGSGVSLAANETGRG